MIHKFNAFSDNYIWGIQNENTFIVVDPGESVRVREFIKNSPDVKSLACILITHNHHDHVGGISELLPFMNENTGISVKVNGKNLTSPPFIFGPPNCEEFGVNNFVREGDILEVDDLCIKVMDISGHTKEHVGYYTHSDPIVCSQPIFFCGDTLFGGGCGRVLGGCIKSLYNAIQKISLLPKETQIYCAHEYTEANLKFATELYPNDDRIMNRYFMVSKERKKNESTIPTLLSNELATNPFLKCSSFTEFRRIRELKDCWKG